MSNLFRVSCLSTFTTALFFICFTVIIDAIVLLTGKFDRNVAYRAALADTGDEDAESLNIMQAIILITVPTIGGM